MSRVPSKDVGPEPAADGIGEVLEFMQHLWALDHSLQRLSRTMRARYGISGPQRLVLRIVGTYPGISAGLVAETLRVHPSTLTGVFKRLVQHNLIRRDSDESDGRRAVLRLTAKGRRIAALREATVEEAVRSALTRIPKRKVTTTKEVLALLALSLQGLD
jgi:MarR family transcriptional regulator, organic hydroperoxide resistance regulator